MPLKGETDATTTLDVKSSIEVQPTELKVNPAGKVTITLPAVKVKLPEIRMKLWFLPFIRLSGMEVTTEPASLQVDLADTVMQASIEQPTKVDILTNGEVRARVKLEGSGSMQGGPMSLEIPAD
ncbi:MAG: hypothetical protein J3T61_01990 [Candidatus Brocadiales bacterium]|nr:hypothetical protein [Candidatus Bathyanammoxibius sp.]